MAPQISIRAQREAPLARRVPAVSLPAARVRCIELRAQIAAGVDLSAVRKASKQHRTPLNQTFESIAREWHQHSSRSWADSLRIPTKPGRRSAASEAGIPVNAGPVLTR